MSPFILRPMTATDAQAIVTWRYPGVYAFYDATADPEDLAELLTPSGWGLNYFSVDNADHQLVGFFQFMPQNTVIEVGLGLHPDLTGSGMGLAFVLAGLAFAQVRFAPQQFRLAVATFNKRAIRVYERAGFQAIHLYKQTTNGAQYEFVEMVREGAVHS